METGARTSKGGRGLRAAEFGTDRLSRRVALFQTPFSFLDDIALIDRDVAATTDRVINEQPFSSGNGHASNDGRLAPVHDKDIG